MNNLITYNFPDRASYIIERLNFFHGYVLLILTIITIQVLYIILVIIVDGLRGRMVLEADLVELVWTIAPIVVLLLIGFPSLQLLYIRDELVEPRFTIKVVGNQWYWTYEYSDYSPISFDSYIISEIDSLAHSFRLLDTDTSVLIPINIRIRFVVRAADVIHSWTVPSIGIKVDAVPGRLNQLRVIPNRLGIFWGQCSEICGSNHRFIPITLEVTSVDDYINYIETLKAE